MAVIPPVGPTPAAATPAVPVGPKGNPSVVAAPVVRSPAQSWQHTAGDALLFAGLTLQVLAASGPDLARAFPSLHWIAGATAAAGALLSALKHAQEALNQQGDGEKNAA